MGPAIGTEIDSIADALLDGSCRHDRADGQDRVLGPSSRLSAVIALFQEIGAIHIESAPPTSAASSPTSGHPASRPRPAANRPGTLETALEKVRQLLLASPPSAGSEGGGSATSSRNLPGGSAQGVNVHLDTLSARAASLVADLKRHQDEQSLFSRYDSVSRSSRR